LAGWLCHHRGHGAPVNDPSADLLRELVGGTLPDATRRMLDWLGPGLGADDSLVSSVDDVAQRLTAGGRTDVER
jgi:hypothetical protein